MGRLHHSTGVTCAALLLILGCWSASDARPIEKRAKPVLSSADVELSIHTALTESALARVQVLLDRGANIEARNARGATPLITASARGNLALVLLLLNQGAQIEARDRDGNTALHEASLQSHLPCVDALLNAGMQTSIRNELEFTPLHQAVRRFWETSGESRADRLARQRTVINRLLRSGADPQMRDSGGRTPLVLAMESDNAALQQVFNTPPIHDTPAPLTPASPAKPEETKDSNQLLVAPPTDVDSSANLAPSEVTAVIPPLDTPKAATALARQSPSSSHTPASPPGSLSALLPWHPPAALLDSSPEQLTAPGSGSSGTGSAPVPEPTGATPPLQPNRESQASPPAPQPITPQGSDKHTATTAELEHTPVSPSIPSDRPVDVDSARPTLPSPPAATEHPQPAPVPTSSTQDHRESVQARVQHERAFSPIRLAQATSPVETRPGDPALLPTPSSQSTGNSGPPVVPLSAQTSPAPLSGHREEPAAEDQAKPSLFQNVGFGLGLSWTHNLGPRRVDSVSVVNRIVRIDDERNDLVRAMPEVHLWIDRWDEQRWSWGPFLAVAPGSRIIDAVGGGLMVGYRPRRSDQYSFNFGIGGILDLDTRILGDGIIANEPLPPRETSARTKQTTGAGLLLLFSVGWDLSAPRHSPQPDRK